MSKDWYVFVEEEKEKNKKKEGQMYPDEKGSTWQRKHESYSLYDGRSGSNREEDYN